MSERASENETKSDTQRERGDSCSGVEQNNLELSSVTNYIHSMEDETIASYEQVNKYIQIHYAVVDPVA